MFSSEGYVTDIIQSNSKNTGQHERNVMLLLVRICN
jgi:hypothetical protein